MSEKIYIYGASGHGLVCADIALAVGYKEVIFLDDDEKKAQKFTPNLPKHDIFIAVGDNCARERLAQMVQNAGFECVSLVHPSAVIAPSASVSGANVAVMASVVINARAKVLAGAILNTACIIEHECIVGEFAHISIGAKLAGNVSVGARCFLGANSCVLPNLRLCAGVVLGAGAVATKNIEQSGVFVGVPARLMASKADKKGVKGKKNSAKSVNSNPKSNLNSQNSSKIHTKRAENSKKSVSQKDKK